MMPASATTPLASLKLLFGVIWSRVRAALTPSVLSLSALVLLLTFSLARSTATAAWVPGLEVLPLVALFGVLFLGILALLPLSWPASWGLGVVTGALVAALAAAPVLQSAHPLDPSGLRFLFVWWQRISSGEAFSDPSFYLFGIAWLLWATGGWLIWCVLRWQRALVGLAPTIIIFASNLLNFPTDQNGYVLSILVLTIALLLWSNYTSSIARVHRAHIKLTGDSRWDFWESGLVAMAALIVLAIMLPPLSTTDQSRNLQQRFGHGGLTGNGTGNGSGSTGFSTEVPLGGALKRTRDIVFTYTLTGDYPGPRYFRGVNDTQTTMGEWRYSTAFAFKQTLPKNTVVQYGESYQKLGVAGFNVRVVSPPIGNSDIIFYPGQLYRIDRPASATQTFAASGSIFTPLLTIDRLSSVTPPTSSGGYNVTVEYSTAGQPELESAGTDYSASLSPYLTLPLAGYRSPAVLNRIHALALQVTASAATPYDKAVAIESYLRSNYTYTLTPPATPSGTDPLDYFLFTSKRGYCQFFASAMGDMLRTLGIPSRLVNGFGPGQFDAALNSYVVRSEDAHTWVEVFFPHYGWLTFEPTADGVYFPVSPGASGPNLCLRDNNCDTPVGSSGGIGGITPPTGRNGGPRDAGGSSGPLTVFPSHFDISILLKAASVLLALFFLALVIAARYLRPRTTMKVWRRMLLLASLAGAPHRDGETPLEIAARLSDTFPEASIPLRQLASGFMVAAYASPPLAPTTRESIRQAWASLRPLLLRRLAARLRPHRI